MSSSVFFAAIMPAIFATAKTSPFFSKLEISASDATINPTKIIANENATKPFVLATSYTLDDSWVANVNGQQIKPSTLYLGFSGFKINEIGQFDVIIEYKPQTWLIYASAISIASFGVIVAIYLYVSRDRIKSIFKKTDQQKSEALR